MDSISRLCDVIIFTTIGVGAGSPSEGVAAADRGWEFWEAGKFSEARTEAEKVLAQDSDTPSAPRRGQVSMLLNELGRVDMLVLVIQQTL